MYTDVIGILFSPGDTQWFRFL